MWRGKVSDVNNIDYTFLKAMISIHKTKDLLKKANICQKIRQKLIPIDRLGKKLIQFIT